MKKILSILLSFVFAILVVPCDAFAISNSEDNIEIADMNDVEKMLDKSDYKSLNKVDLVSIDASDLSSYQDDAKELIDNGTDFFIEKDENVCLESIFDCSEYPQTDDGYTVGYYVSSDGNDYRITPVEVAVVEEDENEITEENFEFNTNDHLNDLYDNLNDCSINNEFIKEMTPKDKAILQDDKMIKQSFKGCAAFRYFYKKGSINGIGTEYQYSSKEKISGWCQLGSMRIVAYAIKIKTMGTNTFDTVYTEFTASGLNGKYVKYYDCNIKATSSSTSIIDETWLDGGLNSTIQTSIANEISSDGSMKVSNVMTYSYNPKGQRITNAFGSQYVKTWKCQPASSINNESWRITPSVTVRNSKGTSTNTTVKCYISEIRLRGGVRNYTGGEFSITLSFCNHR
ncbi:MAG: hypothetical protein MJ168_08985 [Clostridia bacterium]|nr:hypothetical protein [Clostridia bacterium]